MCEQELTTDGYVYLNIDCPYVAWAAYRGILITPQRASIEGGRLVSWWFTNLLRDPVHLERELALDRVRERQFPDKVSRLVGMFCFLKKDYADRAVCWDAHFRPENLAELSLCEATGHHHLQDANWITYAGCVASGGSGEWMHRYWAGEPYPNAEPVWEALVEGRIAVLGTALRDRAHEVVKSRWPDSLMLLEISRLGAGVGSNIGSINAYMTGNAQRHDFKFLMDMRDANDPDFLGRLDRLMASGHPVNWG